MQDHDRGLIVGETTFGKGLVQTVYPLSENTGLALTTAKYYTPSGRLIQRDYNGVSLYDYYYSREQEDNPNNNANTNTNTPSKEVKLTDSGRTMFGGGPRATRASEEMDVASVWRLTVGLLASSISNCCSSSSWLRKSFADW